MTSVAELKAWLRFHGLRWNPDNTGIRINSPSPEGFSVWIGKDNDEWTVVFGDGWHDHFAEEGDAVHFAADGLAGRVREVTWVRGDVPYRWSVQRMIDGRWKSVSSITVCFFPFWKSRSLQYRQNPVVDGE